MAFFGGIPFPVQFFLAFIIVLGLIGATAWAVRRFASGRLAGVGMRGRQPRLAVIDYTNIDARRRLILVRRDNVEHLVMIGGPTDIVVESNIVRATPAARDSALARPTASEAARVMALPDATADEMWTLAETAARPQRTEAAAEEPAAFPLQPHAEAAPRAQRDTLAALADELSTRPPASLRTRPQQSSRPQSPEPQQANPEAPEEPRQQLRSEPQQEAHTVVQSAAAETTLAVDQSFAEMAHRLEAALRKPSTKSDRTEAREARGATMPRPVTPATPTEHSAAEPAPPAPTLPPSPLARALRTAESRATRTDLPKQPNSGKALYDSLEQEMASLLGRSTAKN